MQKKCYFTMFIGFMTIFLLFGTANKALASPFHDVPKNHSAYKDIMKLQERQLINGYPDGSFKPSNPIARKHVAALLDRALHLTPVRPAAHFTDVPLNHPYYEEIQRVYRAGIFDGNTETTFNPDALLTRAQMAKILHLAFNLTEATDNPFPDVPNNHWAKNHIATIYAHGITTGNNGKYDMGNIVSRAHYAMFLSRALQSEKVQLADDDEKFNKRVEVIKSNWQRLKPTYTGPILTEETQVTTPFKLGKVHQQELNDAINLTNFFRTLSYLPGDVKLNAKDNDIAQATSLVLAANKNLSHTPAKPKDMPDSIYLKGREGAAKSNIAFGYKDIPDSIYRGYMSDATDDNRVTVGHRRWILSPHLQEVGFGYALANNGQGYMAMKIIADKMWALPRAPHQFIAWPSETAFPTDFFGPNDPWSVSLNEDLFDARKTKDIRVQLTRKSDGKTWRFSSTLKSDGFFNIDTENYGFTPFTIIFQPKGIHQYDHYETYDLQIDNVYKRTGEKVKIQYSTTFFDL